MRIANKRRRCHCKLCSKQLITAKPRFYSKYFLLIVAISVLTGIVLIPLFVVLYSYLSN